MDKQFAHSILEIKAMDDQKRTFTGIATTPTPDRVGDIVEPKGAEFTLPVPLCWMHDSSDPIGWVTRAKVTNDGIEVEGTVAMLSEPPGLKERLDTAWAMLKARLVRGLSIGFKPIEYSRINDTYSYRYIKWLWLELSPVTVPANGDCTIMGIKSADRLARGGARPVIRLNRPAVGTPGVSGAAERRKGVIYISKP